MAANFVLPESLASHKLRLMYVHVHIYQELIVVGWPEQRRPCRGPSPFVAPRADIKISRTPVCNLTFTLFWPVGLSQDRRDSPIIGIHDDEIVPSTRLIRPDPNQSESSRDRRTGCARRLL
jgi:hypothetical protein